MQADLTFLKALRDKLKGGNTASIHLNALPGRFATRLDVADFNVVETKMADNFLDKILSESNFQYKILFELPNSSAEFKEERHFSLGVLAKRLNALYIENEDNFREHGIKTFGFGYPFVLLRSPRDPQKILKAPLFIWQLDILKSYSEPNSWLILRNKIRDEAGRIRTEDIHGVAINEVLISFLKSEYSVELPQLSEDLTADDALFNRAELRQELENACKKLNINASFSAENDVLEQPLSPLPEREEAESGDFPRMHFGGIFGLFRTQKESIINDIDGLLEIHNDLDFTELDFEMERLESAAVVVETDPSQQEILDTLVEFPNQIIQGPPGTGKSQSLTALITAALANKMKCLVVCEKKTALDVIRNNLYQTNPLLGELSVVVEDMNKDRDAVVTSVRERASRNVELPYFNAIEHQNLETNHRLLKASVNAAHQSLAQPIFQGKNWTTLVGDFLKTQKKANFNLLKSKLEYKNFDFTESEYAMLSKNIKEGQLLYSKVLAQNQQFSVLEGLPDAIFLRENALATQQALENKINNYIQQLEKYAVTITEEIKNYTQFLEVHFLNYYGRLNESSEQFLQYWTRNINQFGNDFAANDDLNSLKTGALSLFSSKHRQMKENKQLLLTYYNSVFYTYNSFRYFEHQFISEQQLGSSLAKLQENVQQLQQKNELWKKEHETVQNQYLSKFSPQNFHIGYSEKITLLKVTTDDIYTIFEQIRQDNFLSHFSKNLTNISELEQIIQRQIDDFRAIQDSLPQFRSYFDWRKYKIQISVLHQQVLTTLQEEGLTDWQAAFDSWYLNWLLAVREQPDLPKSEAALTELSSQNIDLRQSQLQKILYFWSAQQQVSTKNFQQQQGINLVSLYNKRGSRGERRNSLRKIISSDFSLFTDYFPVLLVSPSICSSIVPLEKGLFDMVIFDEASQLRLEDTFAALYRGKIKIVSGDSQQMPPSSYFQGGNAVLSPAEDDNFLEEIPENVTKKTIQSLDLAHCESLLEYAEYRNFKQSYLKIHYRSQHPALIDFSNHAFYGKRLLPMPAKPNALYPPIVFEPLAGVYEDQVNRLEAKKVVEILMSQIKPLETGKYPSVGIATFNIYQRNLIIEEINIARQQSIENEAIIQKIGSDFFVKNLENIQGDERDIIIISTTYGRRNDGSFRQSFGPILQKNGYKLLNVIITRAKKQVIICTSIPSEFYQTYPQLLEVQGNTGKAIFYAYLAYSKAVGAADEAASQSILELIYQKSNLMQSIDNSLLASAESPFEAEVLQDLLKHIAAQRIVPQYKMGGFRIDIVLLSEYDKKPILAIECDGAKYHSSPEAYAWDMFRQKHLEQYGIKFHRIWSSNWWTNPQRELEDLLDVIAELDKNLRQQSEIDSLFED